MGRHRRTTATALARLGWAAAGAAVVATGAGALSLPHAEAEPLTLTVTGPVTLYTCAPDAPPEFGDPAHPDEITNKACGYVDEQGRQRSMDPWIDGQLLDAAR